jgi:hypothetical protein
VDLLIKRKKKKEREEGNGKEREKKRRQKWKEEEEKRRKREKSFSLHRMTAPRLLTARMTTLLVHVHLPYSRTDAMVAYVYPLPA